MRDAILTVNLFDWVEDFDGTVARVLAHLGPPMELEPSIADSIRVPEAEPIRRADDGAAIIDSRSPDLHREVIDRMLFQGIA